MVKDSQSPEPVRTRLLELSQEAGASLASLSELLGRNPTYLQQFITKGSPKRLAEIDRRTLAQFFGVDERELGAPTQIESSLTKDKSYIGTVSAPPSARNIWVEVPRLDIGASAGPGAFPGEEEAFDTFRFSRQWLGEHGLEGAQLSAITVEGDSMEPLLQDGDDILVDLNQKALRDGVYVVRLGETLMVKRVANAGGGRVSLLSQNMAYPPVQVNVDEIEIIGKVVWKGGRV